MHILAPP